MSIIKTFFAGLLTVSLCIAQINITINGKVTDTGTTPISGAVVKLEQGGLTATSGPDGSFLLSGTTGNINSQSNKPISGKITASLHNGYMSLSLGEKSNVEISTYTIQGKKLSSIHQTLDAGYHSVALPTTASGVCFYRIKSGNEEVVLKSISSAGVSRGTALSNQGTSPAALTRQAETYVPINDVIRVEKDGYLNYRVIVTNSVTSGLVIKMILQDAGTVTDIDGNVYHAIRIGNQVWTVENLRVTKYNDGTPVTLDTSTTTWAGLPAKYCYYQNTANADSIKKFGTLYNWHVIDPANPNKIAPAGWHVPTDAEWDTLANYLIDNGYNWDGTTTDNKIAKAMAAKTDWYIDTIPGAIGFDLTKNNSSGFSAIPGGYRYFLGDFNLIGELGCWWSTTERDAYYVWDRYLYHNHANLYRGNYSKSCGLSVRLVRDLN
jgi:uncharacterized protein (TIGR02145 family)